MRSYCCMTKKGPVRWRCSAISGHNQLSEPVEVEVRGLAGLSRCHQRSECGGDGEAEAHQPEVERGRRGSWVQEREQKQKAGGGGTGPLVAGASTLFELREGVGGGDM